MNPPSRKAPPPPLPASSIHEELEIYARELLTKQMADRQLTYADLSERLARLGLMESPDRLNRKVNRTKFQASFFLACLAAMEVESVQLTDLNLTPEGRAKRLEEERARRMRIEWRRRRPLSGR